VEASIVIEIVAEAIKQIQHRRLFNSERGFRGQLQANVERLLRDRNLISDHTLVEEEYQKRFRDHGISHRPDILVHIPFESGITRTRKEGNFVVFELKLQANEDDALHDFAKLNEYITKLDYDLGIFVNIASEKNFGESVPNEKIHTFSASRNKDGIVLVHSYRKAGSVISERL